MNMKVSRERDEMNIKQTKEVAIDVIREGETSWQLSKPVCAYVILMVTPGNNILS